MDFYDVADLTAHWRKAPPAHIAIGRLERTLLALHGVEVSEAKGPTTDARVDEASLRSLVAQANGGAL